MRWGINFRHRKFYCCNFVSFCFVANIKGFVWGNHLNALVHRDYSTGVPIQIRGYEDRIRFSNDGRLPDGWTVEKLLEAHASKPANPLLA